MRLSGEGCAYIRRKVCDYPEECARIRTLNERKKNLENEGEFDGLICGTLVHFSFIFPNYHSVLSMGGVKLHGFP